MYKGLFKTLFHLKCSIKKNLRINIIYEKRVVNRLEWS